MSATLLAALKQLDPQNDNHWTDDDQPRLETVRFLAKDASIERQDIVKAAPEFSRTVPTLESTPSGVSNGTVQEQGGHGGLSDPQDQAVKSLEAELAAAKAKLDEVAARKAAADKEHEAQLKEVDRLIEALDEARPSHAHAAVVGDYLSRQRKILEERAEQIKRLNSVGGMAALKSIIPTRAPIDQALKGRKRV